MRINFWGHFWVTRIIERHHFQSGQNPESIKKYQRIL